MQMFTEMTNDDRNALLGSITAILSSQLSGQAETEPSASAEPRRGWLIVSDE